MTERPILFSAPMVRALLDGSKTQTRRPVKPADLARTGADGPELWTGFMGWQSAEAVLADQSLSTNKQTRCPYGQPGDRLWVRETFADTGTGYTWRATYCQSHDEVIRWIPSIHMPRVASRILLEVVSVRVERLNDCSEVDAKSEGIVPNEVRQMWLFGASAEERAAIYRRAAINPFRELWESINGDGSWAANPFVWAISFRRATP